MTAIVSGELFRLATVRTTRVFPVVVFAIVAFLVTVPALEGGASREDITTLLQVAGGVLPVMAIAVFSAVSTGNDFRRGIAALGYLAAPRRTHALAGRMLTHAGCGALLAAAAAALACGLGIPIATGQGIDPALDTGDIARLIGGAALGGALFAAGGVALGTATRNPTIAAVAILVWQPLEDIVGALGIGDALPFRALVGLVGTDEGLAPMAAAGLLVLYLAVATAAVAARAVPRDVAAGGT
jgi:hypothetical protein